METARNIAVVVRNRPHEALRMALGLILVDDRVDVFLFAEPAQSPQDAQNLELMKEMGITIYSNDKQSTHTEYLPAEEIARRLLQYDHILPY
jgi:hypothetical protein